MKLEDLCKLCLGCIFVQYLNTYHKRLFWPYNLWLSDAAGWLTDSFSVPTFKEQVGGIPILDFKYKKYNNQIQQLRNKIIEVFALLFNKDRHGISMNLTFSKPLNKHKRK